MRFAVVMNITCEIKGNAKVMVAEGVVLLRVQDLEQSC